MLTDAIGAWVHAYTPHSSTSLYLSDAVCSIAAVSFVWLRCTYTKSLKHLPDGWLMRTAGIAAPFPIYALIPLSPFDPDLFQALSGEKIILAIAGAYGLVETLKDVRSTAANAHIEKDRHEPEAGE